MRYSKKNLIVLLLTLLSVSIAVVAITQIVGNYNGITKQKTALDIDDEIPLDDDPWKEIDNLVNSYYQKNGISYSGTVKVIDGNKEEEKILEETPFEYTLFNEDYYYKLGSIEYINKKDFILLVDHDAKSIALSPKRFIAGNAELFNLKDFKKLLEQGEAVVKLTQLNKERIITVDNIQDPSIQGYRIYYSPETYQIHKIEMGMVRLASLESEEEKTEEENSAVSANKNGLPESKATEANNEIETYTYYVEVIYADVKPLALEKGKFNPENKFIQTNHNTIQLTAAFNSYSLLNANE